MWLHYPGNDPGENRFYNFLVRPGAGCCAGFYVKTYTGAGGSLFTRRNPASPPRPLIGASGSDWPLLIRRAYVYCGNGRWLFMHRGNGPANWWVICHK